MNTPPNLEAIAQKLEAAQPIEIGIKPFRAFSLVGLLQLALRHPALTDRDKHPSAAIGEDIARRLQVKLGEIDPTIAQVLEEGWNPSLDMTDLEYEQFKQGNFQVVEVHNIYTLYELNEDGSEADKKLLSFYRPQDWGDSNRWHYHRCKIQFELNGTRYVNHCHLWQEVERPNVEPFQVIASSLFMVMMPGQTPELCGKDYLTEDDFWSREWGEMPPYFSSVDYFEQLA